jgi:predicted RNA methylase
MTGEARYRYEMGQYMTVPAVAQQMAELLPELPRGGSILDPGAGEGALLLAAGERFAGRPEMRLVGFEIDDVLARAGRARLAGELPDSSAELSIHRADFTASTDADLVNAELARADAVIANPPYGWGRECEFLQACSAGCTPGTPLIFLVPLALIDRMTGFEQIVPLDGRPLGVTTGHAIVRHRAGSTLTRSKLRATPPALDRLSVLSGVKLYEQGAGQPPQTEEITRSKPYSSPAPRRGWLPCVRTGDVQPESVTLDRLWVDYGDHLAHPKSIERFTGPRIFVRRVPIWQGRRIGAAFIEEPALCAGDVLVVRDRDDDPAYLRSLASWLCSTQAADLMHEIRPTLNLRTSYPKFSGRDLTAVLSQAPDEAALAGAAELAVCA